MNDFKPGVTELAASDLTTEMLSTLARMHREGHAIQFVTVSNANNEPLQIMITHVLTCKICLDNKRIVT